jgi:hypothetical protein
MSVHEASLPKGQLVINWKDPGWETVPLVAPLPGVGGGSEGRAGVITLGEGSTAPAIAVVQLEANQRSPVHFHHSMYCQAILEGSMEVTRKWYRVGDIRVVRAETAYGPLIAGPDGVTYLDIFPDRQGMIPLLARTKEELMRDWFVERLPNDFAP